MLAIHLNKSTLAKQTLNGKEKCTLTNSRAQQSTAAHGIAWHSIE